MGQGRCKQGLPQPFRSITFHKHYLVLNSRSKIRLRVMASNVATWGRTEEQGVVGSGEATEVAWGPEQDPIILFLWGESPENSGKFRKSELQGSSENRPYPSSRGTPIPYWLSTLTHFKCIKSIANPILSNKAQYLSVDHYQERERKKKQINK